MSDLPAQSAVPGTWPAPQVRRIGLTDLRDCLARGWDDFRAAPTQLIFIGLIYPVVGFLAARAAVGDLKPLLWPLLAGLSIMGPVLAIGLYEISRRREQGAPVSWTTALDAFRSPAIGGIVLLGLVLLFLFALWVAAAQGIYNATMGGVVPDTMSGFLGTILHTPEGFRLIALGNIVGALFAVVVLAISVVSFPMMLDRLCGPTLAVQTSLRAVARNPVPMLAWGVIVAVILALGAIPALVGLALAMPLLGHATWHLYRKTVV